MSRPFWDFGRLATDGVAGIVAVMCDYCDCRAQPEIAALSAQHEEILAVVGALRRLLDDGCDVGELTRLVAELSVLLLPHARREEAGVFAELRLAVGSDYVERFDREHDMIEAQLIDPSLGAETLASVLDILSAHILDEETDMYSAARQLLDATQWAAVDHAVHHLNGAQATRPADRARQNRSVVEGGVAAEADAGPGEYEQHGGDGDEPDVPRQCGEGVVGELGDDAQAGVNGKAEGGGEEPEFDLDDVGDGVVVEPVAGSAEEVVGEPKPGDDLECERGEPDTFEVAFELAHGCGSLSA